MKSFNLDKIIAIILLIAFLFVSGTAVVAYLNLDKVVANINKASNPDLKLLLLESLTSDISQAESNVKSYNLTRDEKYLVPYTAFVNNVHLTLDSIIQNASTQQESKLLADSLEVLVLEKAEVLEAILRLRNNEVVTEELQRIDSKLAIADEANKKVEKSKKIIKGKVERERIKNEKEAAKPENVLARMKDAIGKEVKGVKSDQLTQLKDIKLQELQLMKRDQEIMASIRGLIFQMQEIEKKQIIKNTLVASELTAKTYRQITWYCFLSTLLMLGVALAIYYYIKKSREYTQALQKANHEIESLAKAKEDFVYNVSHELRTPLNAVIGFSEQLSNEKDEEKKVEISQIIYRSSRHLKNVLNDILDFSKLRAGKFTMKMTDFSISQLIKELELILINDTKEKGLLYELHVADDLPEFLHGDPLRLRQIFFNIISNAIKYTPEGSVKVYVDHKICSEGQVQLQVKVKDTGVGMTESDIKKIFNAFEQASTRDSTNAQGTGLGLSITKQLIELKGGNFQVKSEVGKGTEFDFELPYELGQREEHSEDNSAKISQLGQFLAEARILIVDDVKVNLQLISYILDKYGIKYNCIEDGHSVIEALDKDAYDLVLLDMNLNGISGKQICNDIRQHPVEDVRAIPVIAVTAGHYSQEQLDAMGFNDILEKPFTEVQLLQIIHRYFAVDDDVEVKEEDSFFNKSNPEHLPIIEQAERELSECIYQLESFTSVTSADAIANTLHKLVGVLHILGQINLKDEVKIQEALWLHQPHEQRMGKLHILIQQLKSINI